MSIAIAGLLSFTFAQVATPGPANMIMLATGARFGFRQVLPFVFGVALSKQFIIWPIGLGLMTLSTTAPVVFAVLKYASAAYIFWLAWRVANMRLNIGQADDTAPSFWAGLVVHPSNPKAWGVVTAAFANFASPDLSALHNTFIVSAILLISKLILHSIWAGFWARIA